MSALLDLFLTKSPHLEANFFWIKWLQIASIIAAKTHDLYAGYVDAIFRVKVQEIRWKKIITSLTNLSRPGNV